MMYDIIVFENLCSRLFTQTISRRFRKKLHSGGRLRKPGFRMPENPVHGWTKC